MSLTPQFRQEAMSYAYLHAVATKAGYDIGRAGTYDVGEDCIIYPVTKTKRGKLIKKSRNLFVQLKASYQYNISKDKNYITYDLDVDTYNRLVENRYDPIILVLYCMPCDEGEWLNICEDCTTLKYCGYWRCLMGDSPSENKSKIRIKIPRANLLTVLSLKEIMDTIQVGDLI